MLTHDDGRFVFQRKTEGLHETAHVGRRISLGAGRRRFFFFGLTERITLRDPLFLVLDFSPFAEFGRALHHPVHQADEADDDEDDELFHGRVGLVGGPEPQDWGLSGEAMLSRIEVSDWMFFIFM